MKNFMLMASACLLLLSHQTLLAQTAGTDSRNNASKASPDGEGELRTHRVKLGNAKDRQVQILMYSSQVQVVGHNSDEVVIETRTYTTPPKRAAGLKPLYNQAEDNTNLGLSVTRENNILSITKASRHEGKYTIKVPKNVSVVYRETNWNGGNFNLTDVDGEIEVKLNNASATLTNVSGPVVANTTNGNLNIKFSNLNQAKPSAISTINGDIDITLPANTKADLKLKSIMGEIYTDFDLNLPKANKTDLPKVSGGNTIQGKTNGGGIEMNVYTINSDIFIRKNK